MLEKFSEMSLLYEFYGQLLTDRQGQLVDLYYNENLSQTEIGETLGISKQAVSDGLKKAEAQLYKYEQKMGLLENWKKENLQAV
jgi:RNA polymerase sigma factor (sigma-70 family)